MSLHARLFSVALVLGAVAVFALTTPGRGSLQAVEETPTPLPSLVTPTPRMLISPIPTPVLVQPGQPAPAPGPLCVAEGAFPGGQTFDSTFLRATLPATGTYNVRAGIADPGGEFVTICYVEGDAAVSFGRDGRERSRVFGPMGSAAAANSVLDEIARSVQLLSPPPGPQPRCEGRGSTRGGTRVEVGSIAFELPAGDFVITRNNDEFGTVSICYVQGNVGMLMHTIACSVLSRDSGLPEANAVLDQIVTSCRQQSTPKPPETIPNDRSPIRPPDTGDAGLIVR